MSVDDDPLTLLMLPYAALRTHGGEMFTSPVVEILFVLAMICRKLKTCHSRVT